MDKHLQKLTKILEKELSAYSELVSIAKKMNTAIMSNEVEKVGQLTTTFDTIAERVEKLEENRLSVSDLLSKELGFSKRPANIATFLRQLPKEDTKKIDTVREKLKSKILELSKINTSNKILIDASIDYFKSNLDLKIQGKPKYRGYTNSGKDDSKMIPLKVLNKIA